MTPNRRAFLAGLASSTCAHRVFAQPLSYDLRPREVADGLWMIEGRTEYFTKENGGDIVNIAMLKGDTGLILVDTGTSRRYGEALAGAAQGIDLRGVSAVLNTHHHPDHFFGNQVFADRPIMALPGTIVEAQAHGDAFSDALYRLLGDWMRGTEVTPPRDVIRPGPQVIDGRQLTLLELSGHTAADLAIIDEATGTLITGDLAFLDRAPTTPSASLPEWHASLDVLGGIPARGILPGHGPFEMGRRALDQTRDYLDWLETALRGAAGEGLSMMEVTAEPLPERFAGMGAQPYEFARSVSHLYPTIEREVMPRAN